MAVPKKRKSQQRTAEAKAGKTKKEFLSITPCVNCGVASVPHRVCSSCGYYNGRVHKIKAVKTEK